MCDVIVQMRMTKMKNTQNLDNTWNELNSQDWDETPTASYSMVQHASQTCNLGVHPNRYGHFDCSLACKMPQRCLNTGSLFVLFLLLEVPVPKANVLLCFFGSFREQSTKWPQSRQLPRYMLHQSPPPIDRFTCVIQKDCVFLKWIPKSTGFDSLEVAQRIGIHIEFRVTSQLTMAPFQQTPSLNPEATKDHHGDTHIVHGMKVKLAKNSWNCVVIVKEMPKYQTIFYQIPPVL